MFRPFLNSLMLGSLFFPFIAIAGSTAQGGVGNGANLLI